MFNPFLTPEERWARKLERIERWDQPIGSRGERARAWAHMILADHGIFRLAYLNLHRIAPGLWRSAQPAPHDLAAFARRGFRTVVSLRNGREHGSWQLEKEACQRRGLALERFVVRSREAPDVATILAVKPFFDRIAYPALVHCKSGADRTSFVAALYLLIQEGRTATEALDQLSLRFGHFRHARTGIIDLFFERYRDEGEARGIPFLEWVEHHYDPERLTRDFKPGFWSGLVADRLLKRE